MSALSTKEIDASQLATKANIRELELRLQIRIGAMIFALGGVLIALKFLSL